MSGFGRFCPCNCNVQAWWWFGRSRSLVSSVVLSSTRSNVYFKFKIGKKLILKSLDARHEKKKDALRVTSPTRKML